MGKTVLIDPRTGSQCRTDGKTVLTHKTLFLPKENQLKATHQFLNNLPASVDLRPYMTPVEEQGTKMGSCVGNALAGAVEYLMLKGSGIPIDVSRLFIYYNARLIEKGEPVETDGCTIESGIKAYAPLENRRPTLQAYAQARRITIIPSQVDMTSLQNMKAYLASGIPFTFGLRIFDSSFDNAAKNNGHFTMPTSSERESYKKYGWHAVLAVGYNDQKQEFILRNSWGREWVSIQE
ncbi:unnamed protein product [Didymodactylos carnosus]|uniref:Peptidase C1A papain C-terminal domain-containing protein n=1 Tax=Didymodactylos carnosus TaxID=1234261 RepID=A0A8S2ESV2_9BILA|nr:unnamed protein product [Didymodactylos carnosus]CAF4071446.1 unnamed protein product [Didymodactylos carnosus]